MGDSFYRRDSCRLCDGRSLELVIKLAPTPIADDYIAVEQISEIQETYPLDLFFCHNCGHLQLLDVVDPEILFRNYTYVTSISLGLVEHFRRYADDTLRRFSPQSGALVVEIGSNDGSLLRFFKEGGMRVLGIDPAREIGKKATESGIETLPIFFTSEIGKEIRGKRGPAAIVAANNVFAHSDSLADVADGIREMLAPDGVFVFEVSYLVDIVQKKLFDTVYHEHLCYHSVKSLDTFFRRHGMEFIDIERISTKGGSLRGFVQLAGGPRKVSPSVSELITLEESLGFDKAELFKDFAAELEGIKKQRLGLLRDLKAQGKVIAGYGASTTVTTLMYYFHLGDILSFMVDDNPLKQGRLSPGYHIPVLPPQALYERRPDYVVILAWAYSEPIIKKHQAYLEAGGRFIKPLPDVEMI